jgi:hypothetical protein
MSSAPVPTALGDRRGSIKVSELQVEERLAEQRGAVREARRRSLLPAVPGAAHGTPGSGGAAAAAADNGCDDVLSALGMNPRAIAEVRASGRRASTQQLGSMRSNARRASAMIAGGGLGLLAPLREDGRGSGGGDGGGGGGGGGGGTLGGGGGARGSSRRRSTAAQSRAIGARRQSMQGPTAEDNEAVYYAASGAAGEGGGDSAPGRPHPGQGAKRRPSMQRRNTAALSKLHALCAGRPEAMAEVMAKVRRLQLTCAFFLSFFLSFLSFFTHD